MNRRLFFKKFVNFSFLIYTLSFAKNIFASWNEKAFNSENTDDSISKILNGAKLDEAINDMLTVDLPDIAENGGKVPIKISSTIEDTQAIHIFVEKNPLPLICSFMFTNNLKPYVSTRIKMQETSNVIVVVTSSGGNYKITKSVNVAAGGC